MADIRELCYNNIVCSIDTADRLSRYIFKKGGYYMNENTTSQAGKISISAKRNGNPTPFGIHGKLHVDGMYLTDEHGEKTRLKGVSTHNLSSYPEYINLKTMTYLADEWGISIFRLAMYAGRADEKDGYADGSDGHRQDLEEMILTAVRDAASLGIYVMLDWHVLLECDPNIHTDAAISFFKKMCPLLKAYDNVIYEICNEPNGEAVTWPLICNYANKVIPVIRAIVPESVIIVGTPCWSQEVDKPAADPLPYGNLMYTLHFYADTHRDSLRNLALGALEKGLPIYVTECGFCNAAGDGDINKEETAAWMELMAKYNISWIGWNLSNKDETSAFIKPDCDKLYGWTDDELREHGLLMKEYLIK